jgi:hypothetical protein
MDELVQEIERIRKLFTPEHMQVMESLCDVWRSQVTDNSNMEYYFLGRRSIYLALKKKLEMDLEALKAQKTDDGERI